jgi:hypothetical protein
MRAVPLMRPLTSRLRTRLPQSTYPTVYFAVPKDNIACWGLPSLCMDCSVWLMARQRAFAGPVQEPRPLSQPPRAGRGFSTSGLHPNGASRISADISKGTQHAMERSSNDRHEIYLVPDYSFITRRLCQLYGLRSGATYDPVSSCH